MNQIGIHTSHHTHADVRQETLETIAQLNEIFGISDSTLEDYYETQSNREAQRSENGAQKGSLGKSLLLVSAAIAGIFFAAKSAIGKRMLEFVGELFARLDGRGILNKAQQHTQKAFKHIRK